jgi:hypothetical protein
MRRYISFSIIFLLGIAGFMVGRHAEGDSLHPQVGIVVGLNAPNDRYQLTREKDGKRVKEMVDLLMPLYEHDILWMSCLDTTKETKSNGSTNERIHMALQVADGEKVITCEDSPYTLTKKEPYSVISNFTGSLKEAVLSIFRGLNDQHQSAQLITLAIRGQEGPLFMPLIGHSGARLAAGGRDLYLSWIGGSPPYALRISVEGAEKPLVEMSMLEETRAHIKSLPLKFNKYNLEIEDARNQRLTRHFQVVAFDNIPVPPGQAFTKAKSTLEKQLRETIIAAWLSEQDPPMWSLEAYQRVVDIAPRFYPAKLLRLRLEGRL